MRHIVPRLTADLASGREDVDAPGPFAALGPAAVRALSSVGGEPGAREVTRPFWLGGPCPPWCEADGEHSGRDAYPDRRHVVFGAEVPLSLSDAQDGPRGADVEPEFLWVMAAQHYRSLEPDVTIVVPLPAGRPDALVEHEVRLTVAETRALRDGLTEILATLESDPPDR